MIMNSTYKFLVKTENRLIKEMQDILVKGGADGRNRNATHKLSNSFQMSIKEIPNNRGFTMTINYAAHGKYVLDSRRRITKPKPSKLAIDKIKKWITDKGIAVDSKSGKLRTPLDSKSGGKATRVESRSASMDKELTSFAFAIWYSIKKNGRISTMKTDFLKPYKNLTVKSNTFNMNMRKALKADTLYTINNSISKQSDRIIKIII